MYVHLFLLFFSCCFISFDAAVNDMIPDQTWTWFVGKLKGQTWHKEQGSGSWTSWKWSMKERSGAGFFYSEENNIGMYVNAKIDHRIKSLEWTYKPGKHLNSPSDYTVGIFNYSSQTGLFSLNIDGYQIKNSRKMKGSTNFCSLKPDESESIDDGGNWIVNEGKLCQTINNSKASDINEFLIYVVLAQHPAYIPIERSRHRLKRESETATETETEWVTTPAPPTTTTEEEDDYDDDAPEPSIFDTIMDIIISFFGKIISFFM